MNGSAGPHIDVDLRAGRAKPGLWLRRLAIACVLLSSIGAIADAQVSVTAIPGQPFGVARVSLRPSDTGVEQLDSTFYRLRDRSGRVFYPAYGKGAVRRALGQLLGVGRNQAPLGTNAYFLFTGSEPIDLVIEAERAVRVTVQPRPQPPRAYYRLLGQWWREYNAAAKDRSGQADYPPLVEEYLTAMLSRRLGLQPPLSERVDRSSNDELQKTLDLLLGLERLRLDTVRRLTTGAPSQQTADLALPDDIQWVPVQPEVIGDVQVEDIASHVPVECFYVRFGTFGNYLWLDSLLDDYGGDLSAMLTRRGIDTGLTKKMQTQLALENSALAKILGEQIISDVALIGRDTFTQDGAAIGMLFEARVPLLGASLAQQRQALAQQQRDRGVTLQQLDWNGAKVTFLSSPDNRVRSYYITEGRYHLVTTSEQIGRRFLEAAKGKESLATSDEFRYARQVMPLTRDDTVFAYFSSRFFQGLVSPQYQIELQRRLHSNAEMQVWEMARWAAMSEGKPASTPEQLRAGGFLGSGLGVRPDGSQLSFVDGQPLDSRRGPRGFFTPIPDVAIERVTRSEWDWYGRQSTYYRQNWRQMDPLIVGVHRYALDRSGKERLQIEMRVTPMDEGKYDWISSSLGEPTRRWLAPVPGDIIAVQASLKGGALMPDVPPHQLFLGIRDTVPNGDLKTTGLFDTLRLIRNTPGYLGAWPRPGFLERLPLGLGGPPPDTLGYSRLPFGLWRRQDASGFSVLSFDPQLLEYVTPQLRYEETSREAQLRIRVGDISQAQFASWVNTMNGRQAERTSVGNVLLMETLHEQLRVPIDQTQDVAERLLGAKLVCALGGEYELHGPDPAALPGAAPRWRSSSWAAGAPSAAAAHNAPLLDWFRGLEASLTRYDGRLIANVQLDMQRRAARSVLSLPMFPGSAPTPAQPEAIPARPKDPGR